MVKFIHLGRSKTLHKEHLNNGMGYAGGQKKNIGSMMSIQGQGIHSKKKLVPLRFKF